MKILRSNNNLQIVINPEQNFGVDLGWEENFKEYENDALKKVINPIENYETVRYSHKEYSIPVIGNQSDIWYYFNFLSGSTYSPNYEFVGISLNENSRMLKQSTESFFRLEFYKTTNDEPPTRINRRLVMTRNLTLPLGVKYFNTIINDNIFIPIFTGSNFSNKENMYLFWFKDDTVLSETNLTGNTFWMTAKFYNSKDGTILDFVTSNLNTEVNEYNMYYKVVIDKTYFTYEVYDLYNNIVGKSESPITFYEKKQ